MPQLRILILMYLYLAREYNIVLRAELARKEVKDSPNRAAEMAAYMTHAKLQPLHSALLLQNAMPLFFKLQNFATCAILCRRLLDLSLPQNAQSEKAGPTVGGVEFGYPRSAGRRRHAVGFESLAVLVAHIADHVVMCCMVMSHTASGPCRCCMCMA